MDTSTFDKKSVNIVAIPELFIKINELGFENVPCYPSSNLSPA
jgi:hypothetical protein